MSVVCLLVKELAAAGVANSVAFFFLSVEKAAKMVDTPDGPFDCMRGVLRCWVLVPLKRRRRRVVDGLLLLLLLLVEVEGVTSSPLEAKEVFSLAMLATTGVFSSALLGRVENLTVAGHTFLEVNRMSCTASPQSPQQFKLLICKVKWQGPHSGQRKEAGRVVKWEIMGVAAMDILDGRREGVALFMLRGDKGNILSDMNVEAQVEEVFFPLNI